LDKKIKIIIREKILQNRVKKHTNNLRTNNKNDAEMMISDLTKPLYDRAEDFFREFLFSWKKAHLKNLTSWESILENFFVRMHEKKISLDALLSELETTIKQLLEWIKSFSIIEQNISAKDF